MTPTTIEDLERLLLEVSAIPIPNAANGTFSVTQLDPGLLRDFHEAHADWFTWKSTAATGALIATVRPRPDGHSVMLVGVPPEDHNAW